VTLTLAAPAWGQAPPERGDQADRRLAAVLFLAAGGVDATLADNLTEVLVASVASSGQYTIVGREQFGQAMGIGGEEETLRCAEDPICLGRIGTLVGAEEIVLGSLGERAGRYIVNLSRLDVARARLVHRVFRTTPAELPPVIEAVGEAARELMEPPPGAAHVTVNVDDAELVVDGAAATPDPDGVLRGLEPGEHVLVVTAEGYGRVEQRFDVERGETTELAVSLTRAEVRMVEQPPVYRRWWFWTILGVVVAGAGATAAAVVLTRDEETASGTLGRFEYP
jgi:hypothetical protein